MKLLARSLALDDADLILSWRNSREARKMSRNSSQIATSEHYQWIDRWLNDKNRGYFWIYSEEDKDIGYVRFEALAEPGHFEVSILITESMRGKGYGKKMLQDSLIRIGIDKKVKTLKASVRSSNNASRQLFSSAGFKLVDDSGEWAEFLLKTQASP